MAQVESLKCMCEGIMLVHTLLTSGQLDWKNGNIQIKSQRVTWINTISGIWLLMGKWVIAVEVTLRGQSLSALRQRPSSRRINELNLTLSHTLRRARAPSSARLLFAPLNYQHYVVIWQYDSATLFGVDGVPFTCSPITGPVSWKYQAESFSHPPVPSRQLVTESLSGF